MISTHPVQIWPSLPLDAWQETYAILQRWLQIVGKVRLKQAPPLNHYLQATFYVTVRGLTTSPIPLLTFCKEPMKQRRKQAVGTGRLWKTDLNLPAEGDAASPVTAWPFL